MKLKHLTHGNLTVAVGRNDMRCPDEDNAGKHIDDMSEFEEFLAGEA